MTGNHRSKSITRRRALAVTRAVAAAGGITIAGYRSAFAEETTTAETSAASATTTTNVTSGAGSGTCVLMSSVTEGPYYLDGALVRKDITEGKSGVPLTLRITVQDTTESCAPVSGAAVEIWHCDAWGYYSGGLLTLEPVHKKDPSKGYKGYITLGIDPDAENAGAGGGGGGTPPSDAPTGDPAGGPGDASSDAPSASASPTPSTSSS